MDEGIDQPVQFACGVCSWTVALFPSLQGLSLGSILRKKTGEVRMAQLDCHALGGSTRAMSSWIVFLSLPISSRPALSSTSPCLARSARCSSVILMKEFLSSLIFWPTSFDLPHGSVSASNFRRKSGSCRRRPASPELWVVFELHGIGPRNVLYDVKASCASSAGHCLRRITDRLKSVSDESTR